MPFHVSALLFYASLGMSAAAVILFLWLLRPPPPPKTPSRSGPVPRPEGEDSRRSS